MPKYSYTATDTQGKTVKGVHTGVSEQEVMIYLTKILRLRDPQIKQSTWATLSFGGPSKPKTKELVLFTRMLATLVEANVQLDQALDTLYEQTETDGMRAVIQDLIIQVMSGKKLADAAAAHPIFDAVYVNTLRAGESSGSLDTTLKRLATTTEKAASLRAQIKKAMIYPAMMISVAVIAVVVLLIFVLPQFISLFASSHVELPWPTRLMIFISDSIKHYWWAMIFLGGAMVSAYVRLMRNEDIRRRRDAFALRLPVIGPIIRKATIARFARTLATLLESQVQILPAMELVAGTTGNLILADTIRDARVPMSAGQPIAETLRKTGVFPPLAISLIATGEKVGKLDEMLEKVADTYEEDVKNAIDAALKLLEPTMIVVFGSIIALILASLYMPMFGMISAIDSGDPNGSAGAGGGGN